MCLCGFCCFIDHFSSRFAWNDFAAKKFIINAINKSIFLHEFEHSVCTLILLHGLNGNAKKFGQPYEYGQTSLPDNEQSCSNDEKKKQLCGAHTHVMMKIRV